MSWFFDSFKDDSLCSQNNNCAIAAQANLTTRSLMPSINNSTEYFKTCSSSSKSSARSAARPTYQSTQLRKRKIDAFYPFTNKVSSLTDFYSSRKPPIKRRSCAFMDAWKNADNAIPNVSELISPMDEDELAISAKKADELRQWIRSRMAVEHGAKTLLLTGPCGAAKTASLRLICEELGVEVVEYDGNVQEYELNYAGDEVWEHSSLRVFSKFMRSAQFSSIERMSLKHRLLLIEQLPSMFYRDLKLFHNNLREFTRSSRCMIAIVLSNIESCWELNPQRLFPTHVLDELSIEHIKFNAISSTNMIKAVKRMFTTLNWKVSGENTVAIREIVSSADGDIRKAMNIMDFLRADKKRKSLRQRFSHSLSLTPNDKSANSSRDTTSGAIQSGQVETFHFIGKLMYAKRAEIVDERWRRCERMLSRPCRRKYARPVPPKDDLDVLIGSSFVSGNFLAGYVFEHEPTFAPSVSALAAVVANLCEFDMAFGTNFEACQLLDKYALNVVARSAVFHNYNPDGKSYVSHRGGFYLFKKPKLKENMGKCDEIKRVSRDVFSASFIRTSDMVTLVLPMLPSLRFTCVSRAQYNIIEKLCIPFTSHNTNMVLQLCSSQTSPAIVTQTARRLFLSSQDVENVDEYDGLNYTIEEVC